MQVLLAALAAVALALALMEQAALGIRLALPPRKVIMAGPDHLVDRRKILAAVVVAARQPLGQRQLVMVPTAAQARPHLFQAHL